MAGIKVSKGARNILVFFTVYFGLIFAIIHFETSYQQAHPEDPDIQGYNIVDNFLEGVWYTTVTIAAVGYGDYVPISPEGKVIGYLYVLASIGLYGYFIAQLSNYVQTRNENRKMGFNGTKFKDHTIIIGWDHYARLVADQLISVGGKVAIITPNKADIELIREHFSSKSDQLYVLYSEYDNYDLIKKANPKGSKVVFVNTGNDSDKLVTILNMKKLWRSANFIANIDNADLKDTFKTAGVTHPLSKHDLSSKLMASYIFEPDVATLAEELMTVADNDDDHDIKEYIVVDENDYLGQNYNDAFFDIKKKYNSILLGISKEKGNGKRELIKNPDHEVRIEKGDFLVIITNGKNTPGINKAFATEEGV